MLAHARANAHRPFLILRRGALWWQFSYGDAVDETRRWAWILAAAGVGPGDHVVIALTHRHELYFAFLGALWAGAVPTIIPCPNPRQEPGFFWQEYAALLVDLGPRAVVTQGDNVTPLRQAAGDAAGFVIDVDNLEDRADAPAGDPVAVAEDGLPFLQFSSGTTGRRKGIVLTNRAVDHHMCAYADLLGMGAGDRVASWLPLYHDMGLVGCLLMPLWRGASIVALDALEWVAQPWILLEAIERFEATHVWLPNFAFRHIVRTLPDNRLFRLGCVRVFVNSSESCRPATMAEFAAALAGHGVRPDQIRPSYGMAETVLATTQAPPRPEPLAITVDGAALEGRFRARIVPATHSRAQHLASCGPALPGLELRIAPLGRGRAAGDPVGEIEVRGAHCFAGYFRNPKTTAASLNDGWYRTGDIGFLHAGELFVCGRRKEMVIVHGRNFYAPDIEAAAAVSGVKPGRVCAFAIEDVQSASEALVILVETAATGARAHATLSRRVKAAIFDRLQVTPHRVVAVAPGRLIKTTSGKLHREENRRRYLAGAAAP
ncbi:hypothetical protein STHU_53570 [Allostella humosa]|nr:hypothetical protein STHU_53570 [Stella humosa]